MVNWRTVRSVCFALAVGAILCGAASCAKHSRDVSAEQGKAADAVQTDNAGSSAAQPLSDSPDTKGQDAPQVSAKEVKSLRKAADQGDAKAQITLGAMYGMGQGVPRDYAKAAEFLRKAADQGEPQAQGFLGMMYAQGLGVPTDVKKGCDLLRQAAAKGDPSGTEGLRVFCGDAKETGASDPGPAEAPRKEQQ